MAEMINNEGKKWYEKDLTTISPLLPSRVLIISKQDIENILNDLNAIK